MQWKTEEGNSNGAPSLAALEAKCLSNIIHHNLNHLLHPTFTPPGVCPLVFAIHTSDQCQINAILAESYSTPICWPDDSFLLMDTIHFHDLMTKGKMVNGDVLDLYLEYLCRSTSNTYHLISFFYTQLINHDIFGWK